MVLRKAETFKEQRVKAKHFAFYLLALLYLFYTEFFVEFEDFLRKNKTNIPKVN